MCKTYKRTQIGMCKTNSPHKKSQHGMCKRNSPDKNEDSLGCVRETPCIKMKATRNVSEKFPA